MMIIKDITDGIYIYFAKINRRSFIISNRQAEGMWRL